jgi:ubiquinone/menaquinone biosynthesis C-methylase UbiE
VVRQDNGEEKNAYLMEEIRRLYKSRFEGDHLRRDRIWKTLCGSFFQAFVRENDTVLDIGAGYCEFINNIKCAKKYAVDLNEDTPAFANPDVSVLAFPSTDLSCFADLTFDVVFMSNFLEHLASKSDLLKTLSEIYRILKRRGQIMILSPNIRYAGKEYWDFFDHCLPLSHKSLLEALRLAGFQVELMIPRFLPFTTKSRIPQKSFLIKAYLKLPLAWKWIGKQYFVVGCKVQ